MNIVDFLKFNNYCPICGEPLSLFFQLIGDSLYKASNINSDGSCDFELYKKYNSYYNKDELNDSDRKITLVSNDNIGAPFIKLNEKLINYINNGMTGYLFWICNLKGIKDIEYGDYEISIFKSCYYRTSPIFKFQKYDNFIELKNNDDKTSSLINKEETFSFKNTKNNEDKIYILDLNYEKDKTVIWYYSVPELEKQNKDFRPNVFEKEMPLLKNRPNFKIKDRKNLISRFDNWILMS